MFVSKSFFFINKVCYKSQLQKFCLQSNSSLSILKNCILVKSASIHCNSYLSTTKLLLKKQAIPYKHYNLFYGYNSLRYYSVNGNSVISGQETNSNSQNKFTKLKKYSLIVIGACITITGFNLLHYGHRKLNYDENGKKVEDEFSNSPYIYQVYNRLKKEILYYKKLVEEPSREKLLPDPLQHPYIQPPYTLVLELTDVLVHPDWTYQTGWRFKKRPGVDHFLEEVAPPHFEIVIYTAEQGLTVFPILDVLDPQGYIMYRLVRDATRFVNGHHVKDLDLLNRDLTKVIVIDWNTESVKFHPENMLKIPRWNGNDNDTTLYDLAAFLKTIYSTNVSDVRDVLNYYRQFDDPLETFRENRRKLLTQLQEEERNALNDEKKILTSKWRPSFLRH